MNQILELLLKGEVLNTEEMGHVLGMSSEEVDAALKSLRQEGILLGWRPILSAAYNIGASVRAVIEVKIRPQVEGGYDRIADRISRFDQVESCYLMSGRYDLLVFMKGDTLQSIAAFVYERLAMIEGVTSTATHFMLRPYKEQGYMVEQERSQPDKPAVSP